MVAEDDSQHGQLRLPETDHAVSVPVGTHIRSPVTSDDVLHSRALPSLGVKVDACPGRSNHAAAPTKREGTYYGQCSEICGVNHGLMPICVKAVPLDTYVSWVSSQFDAPAQPPRHASMRFCPWLAQLGSPCALGTLGYASLCLWHSWLRLPV